MTSEKLSDKQAFEQLLRSGQRTNKISWTPSTSLDPADRAADRDALNRAIRRASGRDDPEEDRKPHPWKSLESGAGDEEGST
jgi:hypothetical protein